MNDEVIAKKALPSHVKLSQHLLDKCLFVLEVDLFGRQYFIPITKEIERIIKFKEPFKNGVTLADNTEMFQDVINALYLQIRDTVGSEIHQQLSNQIEEGFSKLFDLPLAKEISERLNMKLPPHDEKAPDEQKKRLDKLESKVSVFEDYTIEKIVEQKIRLNALEKFTIGHIAERVALQKKKPQDVIDENFERGVIY